MHSIAGGGGGGSSAAAPPTPTSELQHNPVPGMRALLRLVAERAAAPPAATLHALDAALTAADAQRAGIIDDVRFAAAIRTALPALTREESRAAVAAMHLSGQRGIDYADFSLALASLAADCGMLPLAAAAAS